MRQSTGLLKKAFKGTDKLLLLLCMITSAFGILTVYSATRYTLTEDAVIPRDVRTMLIAVIGGLIICMIISFIDYEFIVKLWPLIGIFCIGMMLLLFKFGVAPPLRPDARTWFDLKIFYFQPSELVKIGFIITFAFHLDYVKESISSFKNVLLLGIHALIPTGLVMKSGDAGSAMIFLLICIFMMFMAGVHWGYFVAGFAAVAVAFPILWSTNLINQFQKNRFLAIIYPEEFALSDFYQQGQAINAMGSGGLFGKGLFQGEYTQNHSVPEAENDMILSAVGEELGFVGILAVLILLFAIFIRIIMIGKKSGANLPHLLCCGMAAMIASQAVINISMCIGLFPVVGITLPFFSAGGSSSLCLYIGMGLIMSIYRFTQKQDPVDFRLSSITTRI